MQNNTAQVYRTTQHKYTEQHSTSIQNNTAQVCRTTQHKYTEQHRTSIQNNTAQKDGKVNIMAAARLVSAEHRERERENQESGQRDAIRFHDKSFRVQEN
jgi:hypothetical protein